MKGASMSVTTLGGRRSGTQVADPVTAPGPQPLTRDDVIKVVCDESNTAGVRCDAARAERLIAMLTRVAATPIGRGYLLTEADLSVDGGPHDVMNVVIPDTEEDAPLHPLRGGTAEHALTTHLLSPGQRFRHGSDWSGGSRVCASWVEVVDD